MTDRDRLLKSYIEAARALVAAGLSGLAPEKAVLVNAAMDRGAEVVLVHNTSTATVIAALHHPSPDVDPVELFRIEAGGAVN